MFSFSLNFSVPKEKFLALASFFSDVDGNMLFFSGGDGEVANNSILSLFPIDGFSIVPKNSNYKKQFFFERVIEATEEEVWDKLKSEMNDFSLNEMKIPKWFGFISYDFGKDYFHSNIKKTPLASFFSFALSIKYDHRSQRLTFFFQKKNKYNLSEEQKIWLERFLNPIFWKFFLKDLYFSANKNFEENICNPIQEETREEYLKKIEKIKNHILDGEVYEVNLSHEMIFENDEIHPFSLFFKLNDLNPAPFSACLQFKDFSIVSSSPERFLFKEGAFLETRPIKGTINRGNNWKEDQKNLNFLISSEKEKAELRMITDLLRNDFYFACEKKSIKVDEIFKIEKYSNVFHMLSVISGKVKEKVDSIDIIKSCFPGGSITGCPKLSSQNIIASLEKRQRGIYTGIIGFFYNNGDFDFNIAIRTMVIENRKIFMPVGGAILLDSDPEKEYLETHFKALSMVKALKNLS